MPLQIADGAASCLIFAAYAASDCRFKSDFAVYDASKAAKCPQSAVKMAPDIHKIIKIHWKNVCFLQIIENYF